MPTIPSSFNAEADIPDGIREYYSEKDDGGGWDLQWDRTGYVPAGKLNEFRDNNLALEERLKPWSALSCDPAAAKKALELSASMETKDLIEAGKAADMLSKATADLKVQHTRQVEELTADRDTALNSLNDMTIKSLLIDAAIPNGLVKTGHEDLVRRGLEVFRLEGKEVVAKNPDGSTMYGPNAEPLTPGEWVIDLKKTATHLFEANHGGDSSGSAAGMAGDGLFQKYKGNNPYGPGGSLTIRTQLEVDPETRPVAKRLAAVHGKTISETATSLKIANYSA